MCFFKKTQTICSDLHYYFISNREYREFSPSEKCFYFEIPKAAAALFTLIIIEKYLNI